MRKADHVKSLFLGSVLSIVISTLKQNILNLVKSATTFG
jgi:hypothetical protein